MPIAEDPEPRPAGGDEPDGSDPSGAGRKDPFADLVLDEEFVRRATVKEQSGRTRILSARWKHTPPVDPGGRRSVNDGPAAPKRRFGRKPKPTALGPWGDPRPRRRLEWRTPLFVVLTVAVLLAVLNIDGLRDWYSINYGPGSTAARPPVPTAAPETARPTTAPPATRDDQPTVDHPWKGSPAEGWLTGAAGIGLPDAHAVGVFDENQVAAKLKLVKDFLVASNLDPDVTAGGHPEAALALLDREAQTKPAKALATPTDELEPTSWFSRFDRRDAIPVGDVVKVKGWMSFDSDGERGVVVHTDYTFVYALRPGPEAGKAAATPPGSPPAAPAAPAGGGGGGVAKPVSLRISPAEDVAGDTWTARTIVRRVSDYRFYDPGKYRANPEKINISKTNASFGNSSCVIHDGFFHPNFRQFDQPHPEVTGPTVDPYDQSKELGTDQGCEATSRS